MLYAPLKESRGERPSEFFVKHTPFQLTGRRTLKLNFGNPVTPRPVVHQA